MLWFILLLIAPVVGYFIDKLLFNDDGNGKEAGVLLFDGNDTTNQQDYLDDIIDDASDSECLESDCHTENFEDIICGT